MRAWLRLPDLIRDILAELRLLREYLGLLARPPIEPVLCACGHTSNSYATEPATNTRTCLACYNGQRAAERQARGAAHAAALRERVRGTEDALRERRARLAEMSDTPRNAAVRAQLQQAINTLEAQRLGEQTAADAATCP